MKLKVLGAAAVVAFASLAGAGAAQAQQYGYGQGGHHHHRGDDRNDGRNGGRYGDGLGYHYSSPYASAYDERNNLLFSCVAEQVPGQSNLELHIYYADGTEVANQREVDPNVTILRTRNGGSSTGANAGP